MSEHSRESDRASWKMARAAEETSKAAAELRRLSECIILQPPSELPEEEAALIADKSVHRARKAPARDRYHQPKAAPPTAEEIREWERRRENRRKREASSCHRLSRWTRAS
jgi:hypothetical protein